MVVRGHPHHVTQRGNRRLETFFCRDDDLVRVRPLLNLVGDWASLLSRDVLDAEAERFRWHARTRRPLGDDGFVTALSKQLGRVLTPKKRGPKPKTKAN